MGVNLSEPKTVSLRTVLGEGDFGAYYNLCATHFLGRPKPVVSGAEPLGGPNLRCGDFPPHKIGEANWRGDRFQGKQAQNPAIAGNGVSGAPTRKKKTPKKEKRAQFFTIDEDAPETLDFGSKPRF